MTWPSLIIAARDASWGSEISSTDFPMQDEVSGRVNSTKLASPALSEKSLTISPTDTASSTRAAIILGVETATSTPQEESKSHSFFG